jgi:hypothetical protein
VLILTHAVGTLSTTEARNWRTRHGVPGALGKQFKGWWYEKKLNLMRTINPGFKYLSQPWGRMMITVHEKMYP